MFEALSGLAICASPGRPSRAMRSFTRSQVSGTRACAWISMTFTRCPAISTSRRLRAAGGAVALCLALDPRAGENSPAQQPVKKTPAAVPDILFRKSLRVGIVEIDFFAGYLVCVPGWVLIHPPRFRGNEVLRRVLESVG